MALTKAQQKLMEDLGLTSSDLEKAQARKANAEQRATVEAVFTKHEAALAAFVTDLVEVNPVSPSTKDSSSWVGTSGASTVAGLGFKVVLTDKVASDARKAALNA